jgi:DNA-binding SARP family transcriptional activator
MEISRRLLIYLFLATCCFLNGKAQSTSIEEKVFVLETNAGNVATSLNNGAQAFLLELKKEQDKILLQNATFHPSLATFCKNLNKYLQINATRKPISLLLKGKIEPDSIIRTLQNTFGPSLWIHQPAKIANMDSLRKQNKKVIAIFDTAISQTNNEIVRTEKHYDKRFSTDPLNKFLLFTSNADSSKQFSDDCLNVWNQCGKVPNFIHSSKLSRSQLIAIADSLNNTDRFMGEVTYNNKWLNKINWVHTHGAASPARFSFPMLKPSFVFRPYKHGYKISPEEVVHHGLLADERRLFSAYDMLPEDKLVYDFSFDDEALNKLEPGWAGSLVKDVDFVNDSERGKVLQLTKTNSFIDYGRDNTLNFNAPISISVWIKPDSLPDYMGIAGFGTSFSFKLLKESPDFTTATIKDHVCDAGINLHQWHHLVVVFNPNFTVSFYIDGEKKDEIETSEIKATRNSLVIGNNVWSEQFYGCIDELKIWNRGLSDREIQELYHHKPTVSNITFYLIALLFLIAIVVVIWLLRFKRDKNKVEELQPDIKEVQPVETPKEVESETLPQYGIRLFGTFQWLIEGKEQSIPGFTPLLKQILSYLILHSLKNEKGVHVSQLTETFWPGFAADKAKDNRGTNIKKLRKVLQSTEGINIVYKDKWWRAEIDANVFVDLNEYQKIRKRILDQRSNNLTNNGDLKSLLQLLQHGNILQQTHAEWLDEFKNQMTDEVIELLSMLYSQAKQTKNSDLNLMLAKTMFLFDQLNEEALKILLSELVLSGKHGQARNEYDSFCKNFKSLYNEKFSVEYQNLIE